MMSLTACRHGDWVVWLNYCKAFDLYRDTFLKDLTVKICCVLKIFRYFEVSIVGLACSPDISSMVAWYELLDDAASCDGRAGSQLVILTQTNKKRSCH